VLTCGFQECPDPFWPRHLDTLENRNYSRRVISELIERQACWNVRHTHGRILESAFRV